jgi:hypothetical protein
MDDVECGREHSEGRYAEAAANAILPRAGATRVHGTVVQLLTA